MKILKLLLLVLLGSMLLNAVQAEEEDSFNLNEIVVTGTRSKRILKEVPIETNVVTREEMEKAGIQSAADAIRMVPGLNVSGGAPFGGNRRLTGLLRGLPAHYSLLLIDGKRTKSEHIHTGVNINLLPVEMIERIEVIKGPASSLYGSEAFGGVINIITREFPEKSLASLDASLGSFNTAMVGTTYAARAGGLDYMLSGKAINSDSNDGNWYRQRNVLAKVKKDINENNKLDLSTKYYLNGYQKSGSMVTDSLFDLGLGWKKLNGDAMLKVDGYFCEFNQDDKGTENKSLEIDLLYNDKISEGHVINAGLELRREDFVRLATPHNNENIYSLFMEEELDLSEKLSYVAALRLDSHPGLTAIFTPKVNFLYRPWLGTRLRLEGGTGFRAPSLQDRYEYHYWHKTYWRDGNPALKPEHSISFSAGIEQNIISDKLLGRLSVFRNDITDMISTTADLGLDADDGKPVFGRENLASAFTQGIEFEARWKLMDMLDIIFAYNFLDTGDDAGNVLSYNPEHSFNLRTYLDLEDLGLVMQLSLENAMGRSYKDKDGNMQALDDYTLINLNFVKSFMKNYEIYFTVGNILDQAFISYEEGAEDTSFGRTFTAGLKFKMN